MPDGQIGFNMRDGQIGQLIMSLHLSSLVHKERAGVAWLGTGFWASAGRPASGLMQD